MITESPPLSVTILCHGSPFAVSYIKHTLLPSTIIVPLYSSLSVLCLEMRYFTFQIGVTLWTCDKHMLPCS